VDDSLVDRARDVVCLAAEPKMMKSWLALDLAIALASAGRFLPIQVAGGPYRVLYLDEENNPASSAGASASSRGASV